ncbi:enoyl-CoA hydratase [Myxococcota bacterium]|nr:enoyl-CoA hydratase [Myxococcota bacterium]
MPSAENQGDPPLLIERDGNVVTFTLNRPEKLNALSTRLRRALADAFEAIREDESVHAVILTGSGRAFCAGVDLKELGGEVDSSEVDFEADVMGALADCPHPILAALNGLTVTGGLELALGCDILIASREARFADTHVRASLMPQWGITQRLPGLIGPSRARQMSFSGNFIDAETAERWGLVSQVVEPEELLPAARTLAADIASADPAALRALKALYCETALGTQGEGLAREREVSRRFMRGVAPEQIAARRGEVQARGREQNR